LKKLRLSTISERIEQRTEEAIAHQLSYIDYLLLLFQDEIDAVESRTNIVGPPAVFS